jgi:hypothetical protein
VRVVVHPEARDELRSAALWYDERRPGLGTELLAEVSAVPGRIAGAPDPDCVPIAFLFQPCHELSLAQGVPSSVALRNSEAPSTASARLRNSPKHGTSRPGNPRTSRSLPGVE